MFETLRLVSRMGSDGRLVVGLREELVPEPGSGEVVVRVSAAPINPTDIALLFGSLPLAAFEQSECGGYPQLVAELPAAVARFNSLRIDVDMPSGVEGAGSVVATGEGAGHLEGENVSFMASGSHSGYCIAAAKDCLILPQGVSTDEAAGSMINPLSALGMIEEVRRLGQSAILNTAAASNLGRILAACCAEDGIDLVGVVRGQEQSRQLVGVGARYAVDCTGDDFASQLKSAIFDTDILTAFDAVGGKITGRIMSAMESVARCHMKEFSTYGSNERKRIFVYGALDTAPIEIPRSIGLSWSCEGWLLYDFLKRIDDETRTRLQSRIRNGLTGTFKTDYARKVSLTEAVNILFASAYSNRRTGEKYLLTPVS